MRTSFTALTILIFLSVAGCDLVIQDELVEDLEINLVPDRGQIGSLFQVSESKSGTKFPLSATGVSINGVNAPHVFGSYYRVPEGASSGAARVTTKGHAGSKPFTVLPTSSPHKFHSASLDVSGIICEIGKGHPWPSDTTYSVDTIEYRSFLFRTGNHPGHSGDTLRFAFEFTHLGSILSENPSGQGELFAILDAASSSLKQIRISLDSVDKHSKGAYETSFDVRVDQASYTEQGDEIVIDLSGAVLAEALSHVNHFFNFYSTSGGAYFTFVNRVIGVAPSARLRLILHR